MSSSISRKVKKEKEEKTAENYSVSQKKVSQNLFRTICAKFYQNPSSIIEDMAFLAYFLLGRCIKVFLWAA